MDVLVLHDIPQEHIYSGPDRPSSLSVGSSLRSSDVTCVIGTACTIRFLGERDNPLSMLRLLHPLEIHIIYHLHLPITPPARAPYVRRYDQFVQNLNPGELVFPLTSVQPLTPLTM